MHLLAISLLALSIHAFTFPAGAEEKPWVEVGSEQLGFFQSLQRSQGLTTDRKGNFWFSANQNLARTLSWTGPSEERNDHPFPDELMALGANHIGDIDYAEDTLFAPIEDGHGYKHPFVGLYDAKSLLLRRVIALPKDWQPDGVPWISVDSTHCFLISSQYHHVTQINFYDIESGQPRKQISLAPASTMLNAIQGGKYWNDHLYMTADDPEGGFALYEMDLATGTVGKLFHLHNEIKEVEGVAFLTNTNTDSLENSSISDFYILGASGRGLGTRMKLYHWKHSVIEISR
jgi:sugar lactone lactonase YvrE